MAAKPVGQEEEETTQVAPSPVPTSPAPVGVSQTVSQAPESAQTPATASSPAPVPGAAPAAPQPAVMTRATRPAEMAETKDASGNITSTKAVAPAKTETAKAEPSKTKASEKPAVEVDTRQQQAEFMTQFMDSFKAAAEGKDPVASAEFNSFIQTAGPKHAVAMEAAAMRLKQDGNDGPGAGDALLQMFARDLEFSEDQVLAQISAGSALRLQDMNKWGMEKALQMAKEEKLQKRTDFWDAVKAGQWDIASKLGIDSFGMPVDVHALKASDPNTQQVMSNAMNTMNTLIEQGKPDEAKALAMSLAGTNPEAFGFQDAASAQAAVGAMNFQHEAWANLQERTSKTLEAARNAALSGDDASLKSAIDNWGNNLVPGTLNGMGTSIIRDASLEEINQYRESAGKAPITEAERSSMSADEIAKDRQTYNIKNASKGMNGVDLALKDILDSMPELKKNAKATAAARRWVAEQAAGRGDNPIPPYDPQSQTVHYYADWPLVTWDGAGVQTTVNPEFEIDEDSGAGTRDMTTENGKRQQKMDQGYDNYLTNTPKDQRLSAKDWFFATKGGTQAVPGEMKVTQPGQTPTGEPAATALPVQTLQSIPTKPSEVNKYLARSTTGGKVNLMGTNYQIEGAGNEIGGEKGDYVVLKDEQGNTKYLLNGWTLSDTKPGKASKSPAPVTSPAASAAEPKKKKPVHPGLRG